MEVDLDFGVQCKDLRDLPEVLLLSLNYLISKTKCRTLSSADTVMVEWRQQK